MMLSRNLSSRRVSMWMLLASMVLKCHVHAYLFGYYEHIVVGDQDGFTPRITKGLINCFKCEHWNSCWWGPCQIPIPTSIVYAERLWDGLVVFASTFEVLVRGFTLGFGMRMFIFIFSEADPIAARPSSVFRSYRRFILISIVTGLSLAAFLHGSSLFVPVEIRQEWFQYNNHSQQSRLPTTDVPVTLYLYIRRELATTYIKADGTLDCPSTCDGEICNNSTCNFPIDIWPYVWSRFGSGLAYLATTLEVLLRGFFLGFGARMLKFMFLTDVPSSSSQNDRTDSNQELQSGNDSSDEYHLLLESFKRRGWVSVVSGLSVAAIVHGSSLFVPARLRDIWFVQGADIDDVLVPWLVSISQSIAFVTFWVMLFKACLGSCCRSKSL